MFDLDGARWRRPPSLPQCRWCHTMLIVTLPVAETSSEPMQLRFELRPAAGVQPCLAGRLVAKPTIDPGAYACRAVVDWLELTLVFGRQTQSRTCRGGDPSGDQPALR